MVAGAILCQFVFLSVSQASVGVLLLPTCTALGWQAWQFTLGPGLSVAAGVLSGPFVGRFIDRHGPRLPMIAGSLTSALCLYGVAIQSNILAFWGLYAICGLIGWNSFGPFVINSVLNKWFVANRGWALAIGSIGISLAGMVTPVLMTLIVDTFSWRAGFTALAAFALLVLPVSLVMRRTPEDHGLRPDGTSAQDPQTREPEASLSRSEAVRTISFWLLVIGFGLNTMAMISILVHAIPFATDVGFSRNVAAFAVAFTGVGNLSSKAIWGRALQKTRPKPLVLIAYAAAVTGVICMLWAATTGSRLLLITGFFLYGFGFGGTIPLTESLWASYFGRRHIGAIRGVSYPISSFGSAVGPVLVGLWFDYAHAYTAAFVVLGLAYGCAGLFVGLSRKPVLTA